jgi:hypothetical protein
MLPRAVSCRCGNKCSQLGKGRLTCSAATLQHTPLLHVVQIDNLFFNFWLRYPLALRILSFFGAAFTADATSLALFDTAAIVIIVIAEEEPLAFHSSLLV